MSKDTKFNSDIGIIDLKNEGDKWQFTVKDLANQTFTFDVKNLKKAGIFDETEFTKMNFGAEIDTKLKIVRNNELSYTHYGFLEHLTKDNHGKPATVYNSFIIHEKDKEVDFQTPEKETTFMGSTYAMLTINKNGVYSYDTLNGTATMTVGAGQTVGDIKMAYNNWKTITAKNVNLTNGAVGGWEINDNKLDFTKEDGGFGPHKSVLSVTILDKEIAGSYKAIMHDKLITPENRVAYTVDGVFGMKK